MNPAISIIVPIYNTEKYLSVCLDSLTNQTLRDIEIICINDGSTDGSALILKEYAEKDDRIRVIRRRHAGPGAARNTGLPEAHGKYVLFVDSDDYVELNMCIELYREMENSNSDIILFDFNDIKNGTCVRRNRFKEFEPSLLNKIFDFSEISKYQYRMSKESWHDIYRTSFLRQNKIAFLNSTMGEDFFFWNMLYAANPKSKVVNKTYYNYVKRGDSAVSVAEIHFREGLRASIKALDIIVNSSLPQDAIYNYVFTNVKWVSGRFSLFREPYKRQAVEKMKIALHQYGLRLMKNPKFGYLLPLFSPYISGKSHRWWDWLSKFIKKLKRRRTPA